MRKHRTYCKYSRRSQSYTRDMQAWLTSLYKQVIIQTYSMLMYKVQEGKWARPCLIVELVS